MGDPAFLVGCHRSGTTLARFLLDAHPRIACPPESKFMAALHAFYTYPQALAALQSLGVDEACVRREIRRVIETVMEGFAARHGKARWIDKTPNYYRILPFLDDIFDGAARFLFLARHPLDCAASLSTMYDGREPADPDIARSIAARGRGLASWCGYWAEVYGTVLDFYESRRERCLLLRYEDLVSNTGEAIGRALTFLGESQPENLTASAFECPHTAGYEDAGIRRTCRVRTDRIGRWKLWPPADIDACWPAVSEIASRLRYDLT
ncbi:MAG: sulfotransferase family protein [Bryobacteraceae bacterium]